MNFAKDHIEGTKEVVNMLNILAHRTFRHLFTAQIVAILGTGLLTIALGLLAFDIAGEEAGRVLGIALTIKMLAYVGLSPIMTALVAGMNRRMVLILADIVRAGAAMCLPFIDAAWQIYVLIFVLQAASATFTPTFQAVIPDVLTDEDDYTKALSLSRFAYDIENLLSPVIAAALLTILAPSWLFAGTAIGFIFSAFLVLSVRLPSPKPKQQRPFLVRVTHGSRIYLATPRLRGLLALNVTVAAIGSIVLILSVVIARSVYGGGERDLAILLGAYGLGSMAIALSLPSVLEHLRDRMVMLAAAGLITGLMALIGITVVTSGWPSWATLLCVWGLLGVGNAALMTPSGRLLRRSARAEDRPAIFAAQFALSHACWLVAYPMAGFLGSSLGIGPTMLVMSGLGAVGFVTAFWVWPPNTSQEIEHSHADLPADHPHLEGAKRQGTTFVHRHAFVIDDEHHVWPTSG